MTREELKEQIDELMRQYDEGEIDGATYAQQMMGSHLLEGKMKAPPNDDAKRFM